jgi:anti-sigma28 factor (negative regulator of flagellin synthesis)
MAQTVYMPELQCKDLCESHEIGNSQGREAPPSDNALMEHILKKMTTTPWGRTLKRLASLADIRRGKVMNIRAQIAEGTYHVEDRLDRVVDRVLEGFTEDSLMHPCGRRHDHARSTAAEKCGASAQS